MADQDSTESLSDEKATELYNAVLSFAPTISSKDVFEIEATVTGEGDLAVLRRLGLALATKNGEWFSKVANERETALYAAGQLPELQRCIYALRNIADLIEGAVLRTEVALCKWEDVDRLKDQAESYALFQKAG